jgi:RNA polymerase sigma factor (sigma-70 family)
MDRRYKTGKNNRSTYIYYSQKEGCDHDIKVVLKSGEDGITETMIEILHALDDEEFDNTRRADDHRDCYLFASDAVDHANQLDHLPAENNDLDDLLDLKIRDFRIRQAVADLEPTQQELVQQIFFKGHTAAEIAAERGVSRAAISQQLKRIYHHLQKYLLQGG